MSASPLRCCIIALLALAPLTSGCTDFKVHDVEAPPEAAASTRPPLRGIAGAQGAHTIAGAPEEETGGFNGTNAAIAAGAPILEDSDKNREAMAAAAVGLFESHGPAKTVDPQSCDILLRLAPVALSRPRGDEGWRTAMNWIGILPGFYFLLFFQLIHSEREPPIRLRYDLIVHIPPDETLATYSVTASARVLAQEDVFTSKAWLEAALEQTRGPAARALVAQMRADDALRAQIRDYVEIPDDLAPEIEPLLVAQDSGIPRARWRNRMLLQAKNLSLPKALRDRKTGELSALATRLERTILDLNHEAESAKNQAQDLLAKAPEAGGDPAKAAALRELGVAYRERIEVLKPMLAAVKEEIGNRGR